MKGSKREKELPSSQFTLSGGKTDVYQQTLHLIKQVPSASFFLLASQHNHFIYAAISSA